MVDVAAEEEVSRRYIRLTTHSDLDVCLPTQLEVTVHHCQL